MNVVTVFVEQRKTLDINAKTTSKQHVLYESSPSSVSLDLYYFASTAASSLVATRGFVVKTMTLKK